MGGEHASKKGTNYLTEDYVVVQVQKRFSV